MKHYVPLNELDSNTIVPFSYYLNTSERCLLDMLAANAKTLLWFLGLNSPSRHLLKAV